MKQHTTSFTTMMTVILLSCSITIYAQQKITALEHLEQDLEHYAKLKKRLDRNPSDRKLQQEAITTMSQAAYRVYFNQSMAVPAGEKQMIYYTYICLLQKYRPLHYDIEQYSGYIFHSQFDGYRTTYDLKLLYAIAQLNYAAHELDKAKTIHRLRITHEMLTAMKESPITLDPDADTYRQWTGLDVSEATRQRLLAQVEQLLQGYNAADYYAAAQSMLRYWLMRDKTKMSVAAAKRHFDTYEYAYHKTKELGYPDANTVLGRYYEQTGDTEMALTTYLIAAKSGGTEGRINAARIIIDGKGGDKHGFQEALQLLTNAQRDPMFDFSGGAEQIARLYEKGLAVPQNDSLALRYYAIAYKAAQRGMATASTQERQEMKAHMAHIDNIAAHINTIMNRMELQYLQHQTHRISDRQMTADEMTELAARYMLLGDAETCMSLVQQAATKGSKKAQRCLDWHASSPKFSLKYIVNNTLQK